MIVLPRTRDLDAHQVSVNVVVLDLLRVEDDAK